MDAKEVASVIEAVLTGKHPAIRKSKVVIHENQLVLELGHNQLFLVNVRDVSPADMDNAERIACEKAGEFGHWSCGVCGVHNIPRYECGCVAIKESKDGETKKHVP